MAAGPAARVGRGAAPPTTTAPAPQPAPTGGVAGAGGGGGGGGFAPSFYLALLAALASLARLISERLRLAGLRWRPTVFLALQERPG